MSTKFTHNDLVNIAVKWLLRTRKCSFTLNELDCFATSEIPDTLGFRDGQSILVECKTSRADFMADEKKIFRRNSWMGVGTYRFYLCPEEVILPDDLPEKWGLVWVNSKGKPWQVVGPQGNIWSNSGKDFVHERNVQAEWGLMASALRRLHSKGVLPMIYSKDRTDAI